MKRLGFALFVLTIAAGLVFAAPLPPGGQEINSLVSPLFLAGSPSVTSTESPQADVINPAASGGAQRTVLDLSVVGITNVAGPISYDGTVINLGLTAPTNYGVYTVSAHYLYTGSSLGLGTLGTANFSFAKDLYPGLLIGAGLALTLGQGPSPSPGVAGNTDWGLGLNLGFLVLSGDIGILKDFRWGAAFDNIGKGFAPTNSPYAAYPAPFTPEIGLGFSLIRTKSVNFGFDSTLSSPTFSDVRLDLGTTFTIEETVSLHLATAMTLNNTLHPTEYPPRYFPLSGGITVRFATKLPGNAKYLAERGWSRSEVRPTISVTPLENSELAIGAGLNIALGQLDTTPPTITEDYPTPQWISPNNDGIKDSLGLPVRIVDNRFVYGYKFQVSDKDGAVVREIDNPDYRPESQGVQNVLDRLVAVKKGIPIPSTFVWDGRNGTGQVVPDGAYTFTVTSWDENGNSATTASLPVYVKVTPPQLTLQPVTGNDLIFSPGGSGLKNTLEITQTGSSDVMWTGKFVDSAGTTARAIEWKNSAPPSFAWDGRDGSGKIAADGVYAYRISATDLAGNTTSGSIENIIVNTLATPVQLGINPAAFSPGTGSAIQNITFTLDVPVRTDVVSWNLVVLDSKGSAVRTISGGSELPATYLFNGKTDAGAVLAEGIYHGTLDVLYRNGHNPQATSPAITVDLTPPDARLTADVLVFSPNGESPRANMIFHATASDEVTWSGEVKTPNGNAVKSYSWVGKPDATITWDGREQNGKLAPDGTYLFVVEAVDKAGNTGRSNS
ncbi:MAG TPA: FlgD immunoglobulin-like domain containing protein, partial [Spirochaetia bacterium]|nr:FlgD immunoglobulin-like domain containing protein [Spirochaetia bacterium]